MKATGIPIYPGVVCGNALIILDRFDFAANIKADLLQEQDEKKTPLDARLTKPTGNFLML